MHAANLVIVHGAFGGGWEWGEVATRLRRLGHQVWTPSLTGLGERRHLATAETGLATHVQDLVAVLESEALADAVLCAASYGGVPATGAADQVPQWVRGLVYIDALVPRDGQCALDLLPASFAAAARGPLVAVPEAVLPPQGGVAPDRWQRYVTRLVPQPTKTFTQRLQLTGAVEQLPRAFLRCTRSALPGDPIEPMARRARSEGWVYGEIAAPHDPHLFAPDGTATAIDNLVHQLLRGTTAGHKPGSTSGRSA